MVDIATNEARLSAIGVQLEEARSLQQKLLLEQRQAAVRTELTNDRRVLSIDHKEIGELVRLNRAVEAGQQLILKLERDYKDTKRSLDLGRAQSAVMASRAAAAQSSEVEHARWFEVNTPSGRVVRHRHASLESIRAALEPGYSVRSELFGCDEEGNGGFAIMTGQRAALLKALAEMSEA